MLPLSPTSFLTHQLFFMKKSWCPSLPDKTRFPKKEILSKPAHIQHTFCILFLIISNMYFVMFWKKVGLPPALFFSVCNIFPYYRIIFISFRILFAKEKKSVIAYLKNLSVCLQTPSILPFSFPSTIQTDFLSVKFIFHATISRLFSSIAKKTVFASPLPGPAAA